MKGHVKIELLDHSSGRIKRIERDNMLTNAIMYRTGIDVNDSITLSSHSMSILPLATKGLGGLLMFDGPLEENPENVHFPMNVHLTGCAGRGNGNSTSTLQGTIDPTASGYENGKYTTVWNFLPNQANGVIASLALTHAAAGELPFKMYRGDGGNRIVSGNRHFLAMDPQTDNAYFSYNYASDKTISFYKIKLFRHLLRVNSPYISSEECILEYDLSSETITDRGFWDVSPDYDGYVYLCATAGNETGNATIYLRRLKASAGNYSFEEDMDFRQTLTLPGVQARASSDSKSNNSLSVCVSNGYLYILSYDRKSVYRVLLTDTSDVRQITPAMTNYSVMDNGIYPHRDGGLWTLFCFAIPNSTGGTDNRRTRGILHEDGECRCDLAVYNTGFWYLKEYCGYVTDDLRMFSSGNVFSNACQNYIGTICNLEEPITKTDLNSLKVTYTITDG